MSACAIKPFVTKRLRHKSNILHFVGTRWNVEHHFTTIYATLFSGLLGRSTCIHASLYSARSVVLRLFRKTLSDAPKEHPEDRSAEFRFALPLLAQVRLLIGRHVRISTKAFWTGRRQFWRGAFREAKRQARYGRAIPIGNPAILSPEIRIVRLCLVQPRRCSSVRIVRQHT